jgi:hypothetical protein
MLTTGGYLSVQRGDTFDPQGNSFVLNVLQFDAALRLVSQSSLMLSAGPMSPGAATTFLLADVNGDGLRPAISTMTDSWIWP